MMPEYPREQLYELFTPNVLLLADTELAPARDGRDDGQ